MEQLLSNGKADFFQDGFLNMEVAKGEEDSGLEGRTDAFKHTYTRRRIVAVKHQVLEEPDVGLVWDDGWKVEG